MEYLKSKSSKFNGLIILPIITLLIIPIVVLDICIEIYHRVCFPLCSIPIVSRRNYIQIDRQKLPYLNIIQKFYCVYCGYANGVIHYWSKIAGDTERFWCGIKHKENSNFIPPEHHKDFTKYGDENEFNQKYKD